MLVRLSPAPPRIFVICVAMLVFAAGCEVTHDVELTYVPTGTLPASVSRNVTLRLQVKDSRQTLEVDSVGILVNKYNVQTATVEKAMRLGFTDALQTLGYRIGDDSELSLEASLTKLTFDRGVAFGGNASMTISVKRGSNLVAFRQLEVTSVRDHLYLSPCISKLIDDALVDPVIVSALETGKSDSIVENITSTTHQVVQGRQEAANRWAVVIGVAKYKFSGQAGLNNLAFADQDATDFAAALKRQGWSDDHLLLLTNDQADKRGIEHALESWLRKADPGDDIILFWSAHGWPDVKDPERAYFGCYDALPSDPSTGVRMDYVRRTIKDYQPGHVIVIADTCHSGMAIRGNDSKGISVAPALESMEKKKDIPKGWIFVASADSDRSAYEDKAWKHGAPSPRPCSRACPERPTGTRAAGAKDGIITLGELRAYITDRMGEEGLTVVGAKLLPLFYTTSGDPSIWDLDLRGK